MSQSWSHCQRVDHFRELLEDKAYQLTDRRGLSDLIPFIHAEEHDRTKAELNGQALRDF